MAPLISTHFSHHSLKSALTTRYLMPGRARTFALTQPRVIDKGPAFEILNRMLIALHQRVGSDRPLRVLDLGCGAPFFLQHLLSVAGGEHLRLQYTGIDISKEMIDAFPSSLCGESDCEIELDLHSGINIPVDGLERALPLETTTPFDLIIALQFSHYFPNTVGSPLWERFIKNGLRPLTKVEFWKHCAEYLHTGGVYADFDDTLHENPQENRKLEDAWDRYGLQRLTDEGFLSDLKASDSMLHRQITALYRQNLDFGEALKRYKEARLVRRCQDCEENASAEFVAEGLSGIFDSIETYQHPELKNFFLWISREPGICHMGKAGRESNAWPADEIKTW